MFNEADVSLIHSCGIGVREGNSSHTICGSVRQNTCSHEWIGLVAQNGSCVINTVLHSVCHNFR